jgi:hypothetical protein
LVSTVKVIYCLQWACASRKETRQLGTHGKKQKQKRKGLEYPQSQSRKLPIEPPSGPGNHLEVVHTQMVTRLRDLGLAGIK